MCSSTNFEANHVFTWMNPLKLSADARKSEQMLAWSAAFKAMPKFARRFCTPSFG
jgi:hypothetical protein